MADAPVVHIGENSPEHVAYRLLVAIARAEKKEFNMVDGRIERKWILDTYAECLDVIQNPARRLSTRS